ncbi:hypothetical protein, partial [Vibrio splendidus]|uniref:hypothetical protein n=1 Tax=Vibrio splendidus TaxID=29497 RepID=UPI00148C334D
QLRKRKFEKIKNKFKNRKGNLFFMDGATEKASSYILEQSKNGCDGEYLQIPANILHSQKEVALIKLKERLKNKCDKNYNFAYLGRVEDFKYPPLKSLLIELDLILDYKVTFTIIGGGRNLNNILELELNNIVLVSKNKLNLEESTRFLSNNIDLLFAMGTSALDGAALGIPVVLLNPSNSYSNDTRYRRLYAVSYTHL